MFATFNQLRRLIFLLRPVEEIAASQARMIQRRGTAGMEGSPAAVATRLHHHRSEILSFLRDAAQKWPKPVPKRRANEGLPILRAEYAMRI